LYHNALMPIAVSNLAGGEQVAKAPRAGAEQARSRSTRRRDFTNNEKQPARA
jgi:hypothetical protein